MWYARNNQGQRQPGRDEAKRPGFAYRRLPHNTLLVSHDDSGEWSRLPATMEKSRCIDYAKTSTAIVWYDDFHRADFA
ncbi:MULTISPECIES: hypothetical protein [Bradyrhizobium]|uniref:hypothetical protein n=1 Tax=Bradyrhizobium TaxID=374 RepID=UPI001569AB9C|nr:MULTISPECIES: hypothetical protein [Bradyrhizobium]